MRVETLRATDAETRALVAGVVGDAEPGHYTSDSLSAADRSALVRAYGLARFMAERHRGRGTGEADSLAARLHMRSGWAAWRLGDLEGALLGYGKALAAREALPETLAVETIRSLAYAMTGTPGVVPLSADTVYAMQLYDEAERAARELGLNREAAVIVRCKLALLDTTVRALPPAPIRLDETWLDSLDTEPVVLLLLIVVIWAMQRQLVEREAADTSGLEDHEGEGAEDDLGAEDEAG